MNVGVIGAGVSGLSMARILQHKHKVTVLEAKQKGGLIRCEQNNGHTYHLVGGHVFNSKNGEVLEWFWSFFDKENEFLAAQRNAKIWLDNAYVGYPIENHLYELPPKIARKIINELLALQKKNEIFSSFEELTERYSNLGDFLHSNFGNTLFQMYFEPYNQKIWQRSPHSISLAWLEGKLPMLNIEDVLANNIIRKEEEEMVHANFFYPKNGGSQFIVNRLSEGVDLQENTPLKTLVFEDDTLFVNGEKQFDTVIYTGDVRKLPSVLKGEKLQQLLAPWQTQLRQLAANGTTNLLCETDDTDLSWLYLPEANLRPHRIIYTGNFSPNNQPENSRRSCTVEFSGYRSKEAAFEIVKKMPGNLKPIAYHYQDNSYVIQNNDTRQLIAEVQEALLPYRIFLLGRFAKWEYYNMDKCIEAALDLEKQL